MENNKIPLNLIVAVCNNMGIGKNGSLPWPRLPKESKYFQKITTRCKNPEKRSAVILGRKTWESIPEAYRPLKGRINVVISRVLDSRKMSDGVHVFPSFEDAVNFLTESEMADKIETIWSIGGREIYQLGLSHPAFHRLYLTRILADYDCDVIFPEIDLSTMKIVQDDDVRADIQEENGVKYRFEIYQRLE